MKPSDSTKWIQWELLTWVKAWHLRRLNFIKNEAVVHSGWEPPCQDLVMWLDSSISPTQNLDVRLTNIFCTLQRNHITVKTDPVLVISVSTACTWGYCVLYSESFLSLCLVFPHPVRNEFPWRLVDNSKNNKSKARKTLHKYTNDSVLKLVTHFAI